MAILLECDNRARPWANLPIEMVDAVVQHLDFFSATRLAAVCMSWAAAVSVNAALPPSGAPCLLMTSEEDDDGDYGARPDDYKDWTYRLVDPTRGEGVSFPAAPIRGMRERWWVGGKEDLLAAVDEHGGARLLNPYTGGQIDLPRRAGAGTGRAFDRIIVCATPSDDSGGYLVIGMPVGQNNLEIARGGGDGRSRWTPLRNRKGRYSYFADADYKDAVVHKGKVFAVDTSGSIYAWNIQRGGGGTCSGIPAVLRRPHVDVGELEVQPESWKLAESADGRRLLLVCTYGVMVAQRRFSIFDLNGSSCLEFVAQGVCLYERDVDAAGGGGWSPVTSLGDHSLFLGASYPFMARAVNNKGSSSDPEWRLGGPNCVCFAKGQQFESEYDVEVFDVGAEVNIGNEYKFLWSDSRHRYHYQEPIWFRPMLKNYGLECANSKNYDLE
ncbi:unnamed protein product [Urochloa decumbens]|uniref:KIB1-4 beta-propeller domain-containing protein n=1 Tax=Urochloa decumbens TaxID=240449 RepID=A0ABC8ZNC7_9POAL